MKIKLTNKELSNLELFVLDKNNSRKANRIKTKFINGKSKDRYITTHLADDEYLFLLDCIEENICQETSDIYDRLIMQDSKELIKPIMITNTII